MKIKNQKSKIKNNIRMADITAKEDTKREAIAQAEVILKPQTLEYIKANKIAKGNVFAAAQIAGIMAAKKTSEIIPLCHPLQVTDVEIKFGFIGKNKVLIRSRVSCIGKTGVEMEAFTAVSIAALTIYDMCKSLDRGMIISEIKLIKKSGGKSGVWER